MKALKWLGIALVAYVGIVVLFESLIGYFQPANEATLSLTVYEEDGAPHHRVLSRIEREDDIYVAVNHWPRAWFHALQENPNVQVAFGDRDFAGTAVVVDDPTEITRIKGGRSVPLFFRFLTGFPPRYYVRLDPNQ